MTNRQLDEEAIFHIARELVDPVMRDTYLRQICGGDQALRDRVDRLLGAHEAERGLLASQVGPGSTADEAPVRESLGQHIGRYKLLQKIGEGGFGIVYMAEQDRPVRRKVALKIIKPGMDSKGVIARFEAERQALAMMDHANIARVLDAGETESGHPYFVMELVKGVPVTEYCDSNLLSTDERLGLFVAVCQAVQHAHQKGVIHRDLKPSNVLVTLADGQPVVKVIDFGVAKAINQQLTEKTLFTAFGQMVGTPQYMSPEQAEMSCLDVDTRSDVYSLGVLLYELLTGTTPLEADRLRNAGYAELQRLIREDEPPKPSTRLSSTGDHLTVIAKHRSISPYGLKNQVQGDLDWIVMKALEKDRNRRYESPSSLSADVQSYLANNPVAARPPTLKYRVEKYLRRHRTAVAVMGLVLAVLTTGLVGTTWQAIRADRERRLAKERLRALGEASYEQAVTSALLGDTLRASQSLRDAEGAGVSLTKRQLVEGLIAINLGDYERSETIANEILADDPDNIGARALLVATMIWVGDDGEWMTESNRLAAAAPRSDLDRLMMAHALLVHDSQIAMQLLDEAKRFKHSPAGLLLRTIDRATRSEDLQDADLTVQAVSDYRYVSFLLPESNGVKAWRAAALSHAIEFGRARGQDVDEFVAEARDLLKHLPSDDPSPFLNYCRWQLCRAVGDDEGAWRAVQQAGQRGFYCIFTAAVCLTRFDTTQTAVDAFDRAMAARDPGDKYVRLAKAFLVHDLPGGDDRVRELVGELAEDQHQLIRFWAIKALYLAGDADRACELAAKSPAGAHGNRFAIPECLEFLACPTESAEQELTALTEGHAFADINLQLAVALVRLAQGDRPDAREHLRRCTESIVLGNLSYEIGRAYLERMEADPNWPLWMSERSTE